MPAGLETFYADGTPGIRLTDRLGRVLGTYYTGSANGALAVPGLTTGTPFFVVVPDTGVNDAFGVFTPEVSANQSNGVLSWTFTSAAQSPSWITVGVF